MSNTKQSERSFFAPLFARILRTSQFLWEHILLVLLIVALLSAATAGLIFKSKSNTASMTLVFNYDKATVGLAPNGVKYEISDITGNEVMSRALALAAIRDMSPRELADCLTVNPPAAHAYSINDESSFFIATAYSVTLTGSEALNAHSITLRSMLSLIGRAYQEYFLEKYTDSGIRLYIDASSDPDEEYMETINRINQQATQLQNYLRSRDNESHDFVSSVTAESFSSLRQQVQNLINVRITDCKAYILENGISRNCSRYLSKIDFQNDDLSIRLQKRTRAYKIRMDVIDKYDGEMTSTVLIPTESRDHKYYMSKTQIEIDYIALDASNDVTAASTIQKTIDENNNIYAHMSDAYPNPTSKIVKAERLLEDCRGELVRLLELTNETSMDYMDTKSRNYLLFTISSPSLRDLLGGKKLLALAFLYSAMIVLLVDFILERREKDEEI